MCAAHVGRGSFNRQKTHCPKGHEYIATNTYLRINTRGTVVRRCRACKLAEAHARYERQRERAVAFPFSLAALNLFGLSPPQNVAGASA